MKHLAIAVGLTCVLGYPLAAQEQQLVTVIAVAPIYVQPRVLPTPLRVASVGTVLRVIGEEGDWYQIEFQDPQLGRRVGYVEKRLVRAPLPAPMDLSVPTAPPVAPKTPPPSPPPVQPTTLRPSANGPSQTFQGAKLSVQKGDKTDERDAIIRYETDALVIDDKDSKRAVKAFPYGGITGGEYSYAKSPRWKTAIFVSPLFLFTSGKKHWFLIHGSGDYALLHLDKSNYRLILAAFEAKTGSKVETVADTK